VRTFDAEHKVKSVARPLSVMKTIHIWRNHVAIRHLDLVLPRKDGEPLDQTLKGLQRLGFDTSPSEVELHPDVAPQ